MANRLNQFSPKATWETWISNKARSHPFYFLTYSQQKKSNIARKLPRLLNDFFKTHFYGRKVKLPSVSQTQWWKRFQVHFKRIAVQKKALSFSWRGVRFSLNSLILCYVSVHFAVLWCSCQIFSLNESFNALLDDYRTREESCSQLLGDLEREQTGTELVQHTAFLYLIFSHP